MASEWPSSPLTPLPPLGGGGGGCGGGGGGGSGRVLSLSSKFLFSLVRDAHHPSPSLTIPHPSVFCFLGFKYVFLHYLRPPTPFMKYTCRKMKKIQKKQ